MKNSFTLTTTFFAALILLFSFSSYGQGNETFANFPETGNSYEDGTFDGQDGSTWEYVQCRGDIQIDNETPGLAKDETAMVESGTIANGIGTLNFDYMQMFSTNVELEVYVNGNLVETVTSDGEQNEVKNSGNIAVDVEGDFTIQFIQASGSSGQVAIDNIEWTAYGESAGPSISDITITPEMPTSSEPVSVSADITDDGTIDTAFVAWGTESGTLEDTIGMNNSSGDTYVTDSDIPEQAEGETVYYTVTAIDDTPDTTASSEHSYAIPIEVTDIATLRSGATDGTEYLLTGEAVLTFQQSYRNQKYIQDGTAGILIDDDSGNITTTYNRYDGITDIRGTLNEYNGIFQFIPTTDPGAATSTGNDITPETLTIDALNTSVDDYESQLVILEEVTFDEAGETFETGTNYTLSDGSETITFRTNFYGADYIGETIPSSPQNITALVGENNGSAQVYAREEADFESLGPGITNVIVNPEFPESSDAVTVSADVTDDGTIDTVFVAWGTESGTLEDTIGMSLSSGDTYVTNSEIPEQADGTTVYYEITASNEDAYETTTSEMSYDVEDLTVVNLPFYEEFEEDLGYMNVYSVTGDQGWYRDSYESDTYAKISGYSDGNNENEDWLITSALDFSEVTDASLQFKEAINYADDIENLQQVLVSTDYSGKGDPTDATWTELTITNRPEGDSYDFSTVDPVDLSDYAGENKVYIGFKYTSTTDIAATWEVDSVVVSEPATGEVPVINDVVITPETPTPEDAVSVSAQITDEDGTIESATLSWGYASDEMTETINMSNTDGDTYTTDSDIPAHDEDTEIFYRIKIVDNDDNAVLSERGYYKVKLTSVSLPFYEYFENDLGYMSTYSVTGEQEWRQDSHGDTTYAYMSGYSDGAVENEDWLISPALDLSDETSAVLQFKEAINFANEINNEQEIYVSSDYTGSGDPNDANWTKLDVTNRAPGDSWTWSWVDPIDLSDYTGTDSIYVGFKYISTGSDAAAWEVDSVSITTDAAGNNAPEISDLSINPSEPTANEQVEVYGTIVDEDGDEIYAELRYGTNQDELADTTEFTETESENEYAGVIEGFDAGTTVYFEIMATDDDETTTVTGDYEVVEEDEPNAVIDQDKLDLKVYPNPGNGNYSIELDSEMNESINVMVFNAVGKLVYQKKYNNPASKMTINITDHNEGIYFLKVTSNNTEKVIKLIKE